LQESGVGFYYQDDFDKFRDLFGKKRRQREQKRAKEVADSIKNNSTK
jgi:hypothetical protein